MFQMLLIVRLLTFQFFVFIEFFVFRQSEKDPKDDENFEISVRYSFVLLRRRIRP